MSTIIYIWIGISIFTFLLFGYDKLMAIWKKRRVPEKTLLFFTLIGGSIGTLLGMNIFRHKTRKTSFQFWVALVLIIQIGLIFAYFQWV